MRRGAYESRLTSLERESHMRRGELVRMANSGIQSHLFESNLSVFTVVEYDAATGAIVQIFDRGRNRNNLAAGGESQLMLSADEQFLYAGGLGGGNAADESDGSIVKWDVSGDTADRVWRSDQGSNTAVFFGGVLGSNPCLGPCLFEANDGYIWACSGASTADEASRTDPDSGSQVNGIGSTIGHRFMNCPTSGSVILAFNGTGDNLRILDSSATQTHAFNSTMIDAKETGGQVVGITGASLFIRSGTDLSAVDSRAAPAGAYRAVATDGTSVFVAHNTSYISYDITNLATVNYTNVVKPHTNSNALVFHDGRLYDSSVGTAPAGAIVKVNPSSGAVIWSSTEGASANTARTIAVGSDFVISYRRTVHSSTGHQLMCLNDSDGSLRWGDFWGVSSIVVTSDDRIFCGGSRTLA